jgi:ferredoxin
MDVPGGGDASGQAVAQVEVTILDTKETFRCRTNESLLTGMYRLGKRGIPVGCRSGGCSVCKVQIVSGAYAPLRPMSREFISDQDLAEGRVLACCVRPLEEIALSVIGKLHKNIMRSAAAE